MPVSVCLFQKVLLDNLLKSFLCHHADLCLWLALHRNEEQCRNGAYLECLCNSLVVVNVYLIYIELAVVLLGNLFQCRSNHLAGTAPIGIEINDCWLVAEIFPFSLVEVGNLLYKPVGVNFYATGLSLVAMSFASLVVAAASLVVAFASFMVSAASFMVSAASLMLLGAFAVLAVATLLFGFVATA